MLWVHIVLVLIAILGNRGIDAALPLPPNVIPYPFGTNIHFTDPRDGEFTMYNTLHPIAYPTNAIQADGSWL
jgi:hypothetical protein